MIRLQQQLQQDLHLNRNSSRILDEMMKKSFDEIVRIRPAVPQNMNLNVEFQRIVVVAGFIAKRHIESEKNLKVLRRQTRDRVHSDARQMVLGPQSNRLLFDPVWIREMFQENERESLEKYLDRLNIVVHARAQTVHRLFDATRRELPGFLRKVNGIQEQMQRDHQHALEQHE
ncbi:unnamed protein product [Caenorhabditis brenneri]